MLLTNCLRSNLTGRSLRSFTPSVARAAPWTATIASRPLSISTRFAQEAPKTERGDAIPEELDHVLESTPAEESSVPWYLQVDTPTPQQEHPLSERQRLPPLPPSPPSLLQPLLEHVSVDLGMDHLSIIDLRRLDPPPALGANLIMIIGTARSEKHLHVSADRLCRWLRTNYKLSPFGDGLLGRNELKLKMRRKAKRSRLLSAVGSKETGGGELDDGIRTGWVCVNVGRVEGGVLEKEETQEQQEIVGFGTQTEGSSIVVQMLTEEKRGVIDLEALWSGILRRSGQATEEQLREIEELEQSRRDEKHIEQSSASSLIEEPLAHSSTEESTMYRPAFSSQYPSRQQARAYHSSTRPSQNQQGAHTANSNQYSISDTTNPNSLSKSAESLNHMVSHLKSMDTPSALKALGTSSPDQDSTSFLKAFYTIMPRFPESSHWHARISLRCHAIALHHNGYKKTDVFNDISNMRLACLTPAEETYTLVFSTMLTSLNTPEKKDIILALEVLDRMAEHGYNPLSPSIQSILYKTFVTSTPPESLSLPSLLTFLQTSTFLSLPPSSLLQQWSFYPKSFSSRTPEMYIHLFNHVANQRDQSLAREVLTNCVPSMARETPEVGLEEGVAEAVMRLLKVAEPRAEEMGRRGESGEWATVWVRCARALGI